MHYCRFSLSVWLPSCVRGECEWYCSSNILIQSLPKADARTKQHVTLEMRVGLRDSGCVCAGGQGPSGASSSSLAAPQHSSSPSADAAPCPLSTGAPRHFLASPEMSRRKRSWKEEWKMQQTAKKYLTKIKMYTQIRDKSIFNFTVYKKNFRTEIDIKEIDTLMFNDTINMEYYSMPITTTNLLSFRHCFKVRVLF